MDIFRKGGNSQVLEDILKGAGLKKARSFSQIPVFLFALALIVSEVRFEQKS